MKIAIVAPEVFPVPPIRGGAVETCIEEVAAELTGHDVQVLGIADPALPVSEVRAGRTYHRYRFTRIDRLLLRPWRLPLRQISSVHYYQPYRQWLVRTLKRLQPDVVWVHSRLPFVPWIRRALPGARLIFSVHNDSHLEAGSWAEQALTSCDVITGCSRFQTATIAARYPRVAASCRVLFNGVNPAQFAPWWQHLDRREQMRRQWSLGDGPIVLYVGRLVEAKGVHLLIEAFQQAVGQSATPASLVIVGSHTFSDPRQTLYIKRLHRLAQGWEQRIRFIGHVSREQIQSYFSMSDVLVCPSVWNEPFGMVVVEAMASGVPVIAFDQGGPAEIITHGVDGWLVPPAESTQGLAAALAHLLDDRATAQAMGRAARAAVESRWTWSHVTQQLLQYARVDEQATTVMPRPVIAVAESGTGYGGTAKYLNDLVQVLDRRRYDVRVVAAAAGPLIVTLRERVLVTVQPGWRFPWRWTARAARTRLLGPVVYAMGTVAQLALAVPAITRWLRREQVRVVHLNNEILSHVPMLLAARLAGCRVLAHLHGWRSLTRMERWAAQFVDEFVCISHAGADFYRRELPRRVIRAVPNGVLLNGPCNPLDAKRSDLRNRLGVMPDSPIAAMVGRLVPWKGHQVFLQALAQARRRRPDLRGVIAGHDPTPDQAYAASLQASAQQLGIAEQVTWLDWQDPWAVYAAADLVVHASIEPEPFGLVVLEAMAAGKPVIATRSGGIVDLIEHDRTGVLVDPADATSLAAAIVQLVDQPAWAAALGRHGQEHVRAAFSMERNVAQISECYDRLLARQRVPR